MAADLRVDSRLHAMRCNTATPSLPSKQRRRARNAYAATSKYLPMPRSFW